MQHVISEEFEGKMNPVTL
jgi:hypothetical protein